MEYNDFEDLNFDEMDEVRDEKLVDFDLEHDIFKILGISKQNFIRNYKTHYEDY